MTVLETKDLWKLYKVFEEIRKIDPEIPIQTAHVFVTVALIPGITMREITDRLNISQSTTSRNVTALSKWHRLNKPGLDLVKAEEDPAERRRKVVNLTPKGVLLAKALKLILAEDS